MSLSYERVATKSAISIRFVFPANDFYSFVLYSTSILLVAHHLLLV